MFVVGVVSRAGAAFLCFLFLRSIAHLVHSLYTLRSELGDECDSFDGKQCAQHFDLDEHERHDYGVSVCLLQR